jgi:hypothetical protein
MDWTPIYGYLRNWVVASTGLPSAQVGWADQDRERPKYPYITLLLTSERDVGVPDKQYVWDDGAQVLVEHIVGVKEFVVSIKAETLSQKPTENSKTLLDTLRFNVRKDDTIQAFDTNGIALVTVEPTLNMDAVRALGMTSIAVMDLRLSTMVDDVGNATTAFIKKSQLTGTVEKPIGQETIGPDYYGDT